MRNRWAKNLLGVAAIAMFVFGGVACGGDDHKGHKDGDGHADKEHKEGTDKHKDGDKKKHDD